MNKFIVLFYCFIFISCGNIAHISDSKDLAKMNKLDKSGDSKPVKPPNCQIDLESLNAFYSEIPDDFRDVKRDDKLVEQLKSCPKEEAIKLLTTLLNSNKGNYEVLTKITYLFIKLDHNKIRNTKDMLTLYNAYPYEKSENVKLEPDRVIDMVCDVIFNENDSQAFLSDVFDLKTDGASTTVLYSCLATFFNHQPEMFLSKLKEKPKAKRESVYSSLCTATPKSNLLRQTSNVGKNSDAYLVSQEMSDFMNKSKVCRDF